MRGISKLNVRGDKLDSNAVTNQLKQFGFKPTDMFGLLHHITASGGQLIEIMFSWVYLISVLGGLTGAMVIGVGAVFHHNRWKQNGARILLFSVIAFLVAVIAPGLILGIDQHFNH